MHARLRDVPLWFERRHQWFQFSLFFFLDDFIGINIVAVTTDGPKQAGDLSFAVTATEH